MDVPVWQFDASNRGWFFQCPSCWLPPHWPAAAPTHLQSIAPAGETQYQIWENGIIFHQPRFPWNKGISLTKPTIWGEIGRVFGRYNLTGGRRFHNLPPQSVPGTGILPVVLQRLSRCLGEPNQKGETHISSHQFGARAKLVVVKVSKGLQKVLDYCWSCFSVLKIAWHDLNSNKLRLSKSFNIYIIHISKRLEELWTHQRDVAPY